MSLALNRLRWGDPNLRRGLLARLVKSTGLLVEKAAPIYQNQGNGNSRRRRGALYGDVVVVGGWVRVGAGPSLDTGTVPWYGPYQAL